MDAKAKTAAETEAYLAKIRKTLSDSRNLVDSARLRIAETDRFLESQGLTREEVNRFSFTKEQKQAVNAELESRGFSPLEETEDAIDKNSPYEGMSLVNEAESIKKSACEAGANFTAGDGDGSVENRKRKFNVMMQQFRM